PQGAQYLRESKEWLEQQKAMILAFDPPRRLRSDHGELEHFSLDVQLPPPSPRSLSPGGRGRGEGAPKVLMAYYVIRQALGGATLAARLLPSDAAAMKKDVEGIARSVTIFQKINIEEKSKP